jgi:hypothetical protein
MVLGQIIPILFILIMVTNYRFGYLENQTRGSDF